MKVLISLIVLAFGFSAQAACPDVSGTYGAICQQVDTCKGTSDVYYGLRIVQNGCLEVVIDRLTPNHVLFSAVYLVGTPSRNRGGSMSSFVSYTDDGGLRLALSGAGSNVSATEVFKKIPQADGTSVLEVTSESGSPYCQANISCVLSERQ